MELPSLVDPLNKLISNHTKEKEREGEEEDAEPEVVQF